MGFLSRLHDSVNALGSAGEDFGGFFSDFATAPWNDKINGNPLTVLYQDAVRRGGGLLGDLIGPSGLGGTIAGGLPEIVRRPIRDVVNPVQDALSTAYTDAISHPAAAAITAASLADSPQRGGHGSGAASIADIGNLFRPSNWSDAWQMTQHESPGQAFALAAQTKDILNPTEVAAAKRSDNYRTLSGTFDALMQMKNPLNDTLAGAGRAAKETEIGSRLGTVGTALTNRSTLLQRAAETDSRAKLDKLINSGRLEDFAQRIHGMSAPEIRDTYFPKHPLGAQISSLLADADKAGTTAGSAIWHNGDTDIPVEIEGSLGKAPDGREYLRIKGSDTGVPADEVRFPQGGPSTSEVVPTLRVLLGHADEIDQLASRQAEIASQIDRLQAGRAAFEPRKIPSGTILSGAPRDTTPIGASSPWGLTDVGDPIQPSAVTDPFTRELNATKELYGEDTQLSRLRAAQGAMQAFPTKATLGAQELSGVAQDWFQHGPYSTVLHVVHNMNPHAYINFDAPNADIDLKRMLDRSDLTEEEKVAIRSKFMAAADSSEKGQIFDTATNAAIESIGKTYGLSPEEADHLVQRSQTGRAYATDLLKQRAFDADGHGSVLMRGEAGEVSKVHLPLWATQGVQMAPVTDMNRVRAAMEPIGSLAKRFGHVSQIPKEAFAAFDHLWRPMVLLTPGGTIRRVGDEVMRATAKFGVIAQLKHLEQGGASMFRKAFGDDSPYTREFNVLGHSFQGAMGAPGDAENIFRHLNSSGHSVETILGRDEEGIMRHLEPSGSYSDSILPNDPAHGAAWERAVNQQIGQDTIGKHFLQGETPEQVYQWLTGTSEGRYAGNLLPTSRRYWLDHVRNQGDQIDRYLPTDELKAAALKGTATKKLLDAQVERDMQPIVHGEVLQQAMGKSQSSLFLRRTTDQLFDKLATRPTDFLSRNPTFSEFYTRELQRRALLAESQGQTIDDALKAQIEGQSRRWAMGKTKSLMHDYTERSQLADMLKFVIPFWGAYWQHASRWAGVLADDPSWVRKLQLVWESPNKAGWVVDQNGNTVGADGKLTHVVPGGGFKVGDKAAGEQYLTLTLPHAVASKIPGMRTGGKVQLGKSGLNLLTHGLPTFGPFAQLPINAVAKERPDLAQSLKWALPYGPNQSTASTLFPATAQHFANAQEENSQLFTNTRVRIFHDDLVTYNLKYKSEMPDKMHLATLWDKAGSQTRAFMSMHNVASFVLPSAVTINSPYQKYIDAYRSRLQYDSQLSGAQKNLPGYQSPKDWFLNTFGPEFFPLTESLSQSNNGVPPTLEAFNAQANDPQLAKLIADDPTYGSLILGSQGAGQFNRAVYDYQFAHGVGDQSGKNQRSRATPEEAKIAPSVDLGWSEYSKLNDVISTFLSVNGISSINDKAASGIQLMKQAAVAALAEKFPDWYEAYSQSDALSNEKKIIALGKIANSSPMQAPARLDMAGLRDYLKIRGLFSSMLGGDNASTLDAQSNAQLSSLWDAAVQALVERNPAFGALWSRWLSTDRPVALTLPQQAYQQAVAV